MEEKERVGEGEKTEEGMGDGGKKKREGEL